MVLASTDTAPEGKELYRLYRVRFQIEFSFRDAKQFTGLLNCQARDSEEKQGEMSSGEIERFYMSYNDVN